jgi:hypothetical protein
LTSHLARSSVGVPHAFLVVGTSADVGEVSVRALCTTSLVASIPLAVAVGETDCRISVLEARNLADLCKRVPLALWLGIARRLRRHGLTGHDAEGAFAIPLTEAVGITRSSSRILDAALGGASEEARIPFANVLEVVARRFRLDQGAFLLAGHGRRIPFAALQRIEIASSLGEVTASGAGAEARLGVHGRGIAECVGSA